MTKPISYSWDADALAEAPSLTSSRAFEPIARRVGGEGLLNLLRAKAEVDALLWTTAGAIPPSPPVDDAVRPSAIPSVSQGALEDRVLAEIDQDGFAFAIDPRDAGFFNGRERKSRRQQNLVDVVLFHGRVCIRKRVRGLRFGARRWGDRRVPPRDWLRRGLWATLGLYLYTEAAALLRLRDLPFVPRLRHVDFAERALYVDCIEGIDLRKQAARAGAAVHDADIRTHPELLRLDGDELTRREVELLDRAGGGSFRSEISEMTRAVNARGVAPLDIKLGNFIRGARTGRLYWIDFEIARLRSQPRWAEDLARQHQLLEDLFRVKLSEDHAAA